MPDQERQTEDLRIPLPVEEVSVSRREIKRANVQIALITGTREQLIFAPDTYRYLGERSFVVDAAKAQAPVGSQLAGTAELSVTVADSAPPASPGPKGPHC